VRFHILRVHEFELRPIRILGRGRIDYFVSRPRPYTDLLTSLYSLCR
jgi:hypothetical protein